MKKKWIDMPDEGRPEELPIYGIGNKFYYRDVRLSEYRNINNPNDRMHIDSVNNADLQKSTNDDRLLERVHKWEFDFDSVATTIGEIRQFIAVNCGPFRGQAFQTAIPDGASAAGWIRSNPKDYYMTCRAFADLELELVRLADGNFHEVVNYDKRYNK